MMTITFDVDQNTQTTIGTKLEETVFHLAISDSQYVELRGDTQILRKILADAVALIDQGV